MPRSIPMLKRALCHRGSWGVRRAVGYSVRTWNSTFQRRSELVCFIHSSRLPSSVTTGLICTGTGLPRREVLDRRAD